MVQYKIAYYLYERVSHDLLLEIMSDLAAALKNVTQITRENNNAAALTTGGIFL